jgi:hypothetical protein
VLHGEEEAHKEQETQVEEEAHVEQVTHVEHEAPEEQDGEEDRLSRSRMVRRRRVQDGGKASSSRSTIDYLNFNSI